jgi:hypothetical protein
VEYINTLCGYPAEESTGTPTHFVDILQDSQVENINTL